MNETVAAAPVEEAPATPKGRGLRKSRRGVVASAKSAKTVIVVIERKVRHPVYNKYITVRKRLAAHDELGCKEGDEVRVVETRPLSKTKRWRVAERLKQGKEEVAS